MVGSISFNDLFELFNINISLEGMITFDLQSFIGVDLQDLTPVEFHVCFGGCEMIIHRDHISLGDEGHGHYILSCPSLVDREYKMLSENFPQGTLHPVKTLGSGVGIIGLQHGGYLVV